jgi:hypothetical protein
MREEYIDQGNNRLIRQAASYYRDARRNVEFYQGLDSTVLQEMSQKHLLHRKKELRSPVFNGMNCTDRRRK